MRAQMSARYANPALDVRDVSQRGARAANTISEQGYERAEIPTFIELLPAPRPSDEQGIGKTPGYQWPWSRVFQSLVPKREKQGAAWPNQHISPTRPEIHGWGTQYMLYFEQANRHTWPGGGVGAPRRVIEHPQTLPLTALAPR
jgi:hypothetical protein